MLQEAQWQEIFNCFLVSRDLVDVVSRLTFVDEFPSVPHQPIQNVGQKKERNMSVQQVPNNMIGGSGGNAREEEQ